MLAQNTFDLRAHIQYMLDAFPSVCVCSARLYLPHTFVRSPTHLRLPT